MSDEERFLAIVTADPTVRAVLDRARALGVGDWWLTAGVLFQTVWNTATGRPAGTGIRDADLFYFDDDTSWDAEDAVIRAGADLFADLPVPVEIRNEARVPLVRRPLRRPRPAVHRLRDAIDSFAAVCCCVGIATGPDGALRVYAPHGYDDPFSLVVRPNPGSRRSTSTRPDRPVAGAVAGAHRAALGRRRRTLNHRRGHRRPRPLR